MKNFKTKKENHKKIVFLSAMAFDANISIIKRLRAYYDIYFITLMDNGKNRIGEVYVDKDIAQASNIKEFHRFNEFLDLDKTFIVRHAKGLNARKITVDFKVYFLVKKINPDVILTDVAMFSMTLPRIINKNKVVSLIHDPFPHSGEDSFIRKMMNRMLVKFAKRYILFNDCQRKDFIDYYHINNHDVFCTFLSVYEFLYAFDMEEKTGKRSDINILFWGRISPYKGIEYLLKGIQQYYEKGYDGITVTIAGRGTFDFDISKYDSLPYVKVINSFIDTEDLVSMIKDSSAIICPYTDATQSGVIMSAFAFQKPVIATNVGGLPEMLDNGKLGILIPPKDVDAITNIFIDVRNNSTILSQYSERIASTYKTGSKSWDASAKIIRSAIESL